MPRQAIGVKPNFLLISTFLDCVLRIYSDKKSNRATRVFVPEGSTMSDADLRRVRDDLDAMRQAAGLELPFDWADVGWALALAPAGAALSAWAYFGPAGYHALGLVPLVLLALAAGLHRARGRHNR